MLNYKNKGHLVKITNLRHKLSLCEFRRRGYHAISRLDLAVMNVLGSGDHIETRSERAQSPRPSGIIWAL